MSLVRHTPFAGLLRRFVAAGSAALVLALTILAASPIAHDSLHDGNVPHTEDGCAVVLFASGVALPLDPPMLQPPVSCGCGITPATAAEIFLVSPRYLRQPERGPPSLG